MSRPIFNYCIRISTHSWDDVENRTKKKLYNDWLREYVGAGNYYFSNCNRFYHVIEFLDREDVTAFSLKFDVHIERSLTILQKMLIHEDAIQRMNKND
jgi:hypothetical protein